MAVTKDEYQMSKKGNLEIRVLSDNEKLLESVKDELQERWPFAFASEISQNERNPKLGWFRLYLNLSLPIPEEVEK